MSGSSPSDGLALFVSSVGWLAVVAGVILSLWLVNEGGLALLGIPSAITVALVGLLFITGGDILKTVLENAKRSKEILALMQKDAEKNLSNN